MVWLLFILLECTLLSVVYLGSRLSLHSRWCHGRGGVRW